MTNPDIGLRNELGQDQLPQALNKLGALGWELVFSGDGMIFKRPLGEH
jgi:hypothetical protein